MLKLGINGFGRIGRMTLRALLERGEKQMSVVKVNDPNPSETLAYLLQYDSVHGRYAGAVRSAGERLYVGEDEEEEEEGIGVSHHRDCSALDWRGVDIVLECSGRYVTEERARVHLLSGAGRVLVSAPCKGAASTIVYGVNQEEIKKEHKIVSNASCTTNCLAPLLKVLLSRVGILRGFMTTVHAYTSDQTLLDRSHRDVRRGRGAGLSMVPTTTGATHAIESIFPLLKGKLGGTSIRVPTPNVSLVDLTVQVGQSVTKEELNEAFEEASEGELQGILAVESAPLVSSDFVHHSASCIVDLSQTYVVGGDFIRVLGWYDNEWGFANRMLDVAALMWSL